MGNLCSRRSVQTPTPEAQPMLQLRNDPPQRGAHELQLALVQIPQERILFNDLAFRPAVTGARKLIRATMKLIIILKVRQVYSQLAAWQNVNKSLKGGNDDRWSRKASLRAVVTAWLARRNSRRLCRNVIRDGGTLRHRRVDEPTDVEEMDSPWRHLL